jgi:long-subunit fatty acid transport protein
MRLRLTFLGMTAAASLLASPAGAFTIENKDVSGTGLVPKFDIEEQAKSFRSSRDSDSSAAKQIPLGNGWLQFDVQQRASSNFGPSFSSPFGFGSSFDSRWTRREYDRLLEAPGLQHRYDR